MKSTKMMLTYREAVETDVWDKGKGEEGEGEMNGDSSMEAYTLLYVK